jgi:hypothetical protein
MSEDVALADAWFKHRASALSSMLAEWIDPWRESEVLASAGRAVRGALTRGGCRHRDQGWVAEPTDVAERGALEVAFVGGKYGDQVSSVIGDAALSFLQQANRSQDATYPLPLTGSIDERQPDLDEMCAVFVARCLQKAYQHLRDEGRHWRHRLDATRELPEEDGPRPEDLLRSANSVEDLLEQDHTLRAWIGLLDGLIRLLPRTSSELDRPFLEAHWRYAQLLEPEVTRVPDRAREGSEDVAFPAATEVVKAWALAKGLPSDRAHMANAHQRFAEVRDDQAWRALLTLYPEVITDLRTSSGRDLPGWVRKGDEATSAVRDAWLKRWPTLGDVLSEQQRALMVNNGGRLAVGLPNVAVANVAEPAPPHIVVMVQGEPQEFGYLDLWEEARRQFWIRLRRSLGMQARQWGGETREMRPPARFRSRKDYHQQRGGPAGRVATKERVR